MQDSPVGVRDTDYNSVFSSGQTVAATFDRGLFYARGYAMGQEHRAKGVTVQLGPVAGPLGRTPGTFMVAFDYPFLWRAGTRDMS